MIFAIRNKEGILLVRGSPCQESIYRFSQGSGCSPLILFQSKRLSFRNSWSLIWIWNLMGFSCLAWSLTTESQQFHLLLLRRTVSKGNINFKISYLVVKTHLAHFQVVNSDYCLLLYLKVLEDSGLSFIFFLLQLWHMDVPRLGVESELQLGPMPTTMAALDPSCICNLCQSLQQCWILYPLSKPGVEGQVLNPLSHKTNSEDLVL